jgi:hypothetical protein
MRERIRRLYPRTEINPFPAAELSSRRVKLGASLSAAADLFALKADERPQTIGENVAAEQSIVNARLMQCATAEL